jgi:hypothetical protein
VARVREGLEHPTLGIVAALQPIDLVGRGNEVLGDVV